MLARRSVALGRAPGLEAAAGRGVNAETQVERSLMLSPFFLMASRADQLNDAPVPPLTSEIGLLWSAKGEVACRMHAPADGDRRWLEERWKPIPDGAQGRHGRSYQCQHCANGDRVIVHSPRRARQ